MISRDGEHVALDDGAPAVRAEGGPGIGHLAHIADVDIVETGGAGGIAARTRMSTGVGGRCSSLCCGLKREKCSGRSGPRFATSQPHMRLIISRSSV